MFGKKLHTPEYTLAGDEVPPSSRHSQGTIRVRLDGEGAPSTSLILELVLWVSMMG